MRIYQNWNSRIHKFTIIDRELDIQQMQNTFRQVKIFTKIDSILVQKSSVNKFQNTEIIQSLFSNHNAIKLEKKKKKKKTLKMNIIWKLRNTLLNNPERQERKYNETLKIYLNKVQ